MRGLMVQIEIECPTCNKSKTISVPNFLFQNQKVGSIKIHVDTSTCCKHQFVAFFSKSKKIVGYEAIDAILIKQVIN